MEKVIFFDRDGTLIEDKHYLSSPLYIRFKKGVLKTLKALQDRGYKFFIVSNQSGIKRGFFSYRRAERIMRELASRLKAEKILIEGIYFCPHHPGERCPCRKPKTFLLKKIKKTYPELDFSRCYFVGDKKEDIETGKRYGIKTILLSPDCNEKFEADFCIKSFSELLHIIGD